MTDLGRWGLTICCGHAAVSDLLVAGRTMLRLLPAKFLRPVPTPMLMVVDNATNQQ